MDELEKITILSTLIGMKYGNEINDMSIKQKLKITTKMVRSNYIDGVKRELLPNGERYLEAVLNVLE